MSSKFYESVRFLTYYTDNPCLAIFLRDLWPSVSKLGAKCQRMMGIFYYITGNLYANLLRQDFGSWHTGSCRILGSRWLSMGCQYNRCTTHISRYHLLALKKMVLSLIIMFRKKTVYPYVAPKWGPKRPCITDGQTAPQGSRFGATYFLSVFFPNNTYACRMNLAYKVFPMRITSLLDLMFT